MIVVVLACPDYCSVVMMSEVIPIVIVLFVLFSNVSVLLDAVGTRPFPSRTKGHADSRHHENSGDLLTRA